MFTRVRGTRGNVGAGVSEHVGIDIAVKAEDTPKGVSRAVPRLWDHSEPFHFIDQRELDGRGAAAGSSQDRVQILAPGHDPDPR